MADADRPSPPPAPPAAPEHPDPAAPASTGDALSLGRFVGKVPVAMCFAGTLASAAADETIRGFDRHLADFGRSRVQALVVVDDDARALDRFRGATPGNTPVLADVDGSWRHRFGVRSDDGVVTTVIVDCDGRVAHHLVGTAGGVHAEEVLETLSRTSLHGPGSAGEA